MNLIAKLASALLAMAILLGIGVCLDRASYSRPVRETEPPAESVVAVTRPVQTEPPETEPPQTEPEEQRFLLTFAGDCTFGSQHTTYYAPWGFVKTVEGDLSYPFRNVMDWFGTDDFTLVNLEGVLGTEGGAVPKAHNLRGPGEFAAILPLGSVEAVTLANNHTLDYGPNGYAETKALLEEEDIPYVETAGTLLYTTESGLTVGVYGEVYTDMDMDRLKAGVETLREAGAEIVVYAIHWGKEYSYYPQPHQMEWAHEAVDAGVDIVYGTHPHVLQLYEEYNGKPIFYSLGNFSFGGNMYPGDLDSAVAQVEVVRSPEGEVSLGETTLIPVCISSIETRNNYQPTPYEADSESYQRTMDKLAGLWKGRDTR